MKAMPRYPLVIGILLAASMVATRSHHVADLVHLPDASWAVFFLAGFTLGTGWSFAALLALAALVDFVAITWGGVSSFCVSPAYAFLLPAYGALFAAGRWYASRHRFEWRALPAFLTSAFVSTLICELLSSGGFYLFSGRFATVSVAEFGERFMRYFPGSLESVAFYLGVVALAHVALTSAARAARTPGTE